MGLSGDIAVSIGNANFHNTDDSILDESRSAQALSGVVGLDFGDWHGHIDFSIGHRDQNGNDYDSYAPGQYSAAGLHLGRNFSNIYGGAFYGMNRFQAESAITDNGTAMGHLYGVEVEVDLNDQITVYSQLGRADMVGDGSDTAFIGNFTKVGGTYSAGDWSFGASYERGRSDNVFEDSGDWGEYRTLTIGGEYQFHPRLIATATCETAKFVANTEDAASEDIFSIGIRVPFGTQTKKTNLTTSYNPGLAAAWAEALD